MSQEKTGRRRFSEAMDALQDRLMEMAGLVEELVSMAVEAALERDPSVAEEARVRDEAIDYLEIEMDERVMELLALQQPMARDLRQIFTATKIANDLERVGDHALNIAKAAARLSEHQALPEGRELKEMARITEGMLADSLGSYVSRDPETARDVCIRDDEVDDLRRSLFRIMVTHMLEEPRRITAALELILISQNLERIADLSTNISEDVVFMVEGTMIKHHAEQGGAD